MRHYVSLRSGPDPVLVHLVGCGGTGSHLACRLVQLNTALLALGHPGLHVMMYDPDIVSEANVGRQMFYAQDIGLPKVTVLATRINQCTGFGWEGIPVAYPVNGTRSPDLVITAVDSGKARVKIGRALARNHQTNYWLDCGNGRHQAQMIFGTVRCIRQPKIDDTIDRLPTVLDLYPEIRDPAREKDQGPSCSLAEAIEHQDLFINQFIAIEAVELLWKIFRHGFLEYSVAYVSLSPRSATVMPIDPKAWERFGYALAGRGRRMKGKRHVKKDAEEI